MGATTEVALHQDPLPGDSTVMGPPAEEERNLSPEAVVFPQPAVSK